MSDANSTQLQSQITALLQIVTTLQGQIGAIETPFRNVLLVKPTGKQWQEQWVSGGTIGDFTDGRKCTSDSDPSALIAPGDAVALLPFNDGDNIRYVRISGGISDVTLSMDGGSAGDASTQCSFTYTVTSLEGSTIGTGVGMTGNGQRLLNATMNPGTRGRGYMSDDGSSFVLVWADETFDQTSCATSDAPTFGI